MALLASAPVDTGRRSYHFRGIQTNEQEDGIQEVSTPEQRARQEIDRLLCAVGWLVQDLKSADLHAARGVALREFELNPGHGTADFLLYVDGKACGVIEAKKQGSMLTEWRSRRPRYTPGLPASLPAWGRPLPVACPPPSSWTRSPPAPTPKSCDSGPWDRTSFARRCSTTGVAPAP